jgi:hypothetical protein
MVFTGSMDWLPNEDAIRMVYGRSFAAYQDKFRKFRLRSSGAIRFESRRVSKKIVNRRVTAECRCSSVYGKSSVVMSCRSESAAERA